MKALKRAGEGTDAVQKVSYKLREIKSNEKCLYVQNENVFKALKKAWKEHMPGDIEKNGNVT